MEQIKAIYSRSNIRKFKYVEFQTKDYNVPEVKQLDWSVSK
jgi:hypothetical protein